MNATTRGAGDWGRRGPMSEHLADDAASARVTIDAHGTVTGWNEGASRLLGYRSAEVLGQAASRLLADGKPSAQMVRSLEAQRRWSGTVALEHQDGRVLTVTLLAHWRRARDADGGWLLVSSLHGGAPEPEDDPFTMSGFGQSPCAMAIYDRHLRLRRANVELEHVFGLSEDEMRGLRLPEAVADPQMDRAERFMRRALGTGAPQDFLMSIRFPGHRRETTWAVSVTPLRAAEDGTEAEAEAETTGVLVSAHDMTEQHSARQRLALLNEASTRIGSTLDLARTAQELADVAIPELADFVTVDLLPTIEDGGNPPAELPVGPVMLRRTAYQSVLPGCPEMVVARGQLAAHPDSSPAAEALITGHPLIQEVTPAGIAAWAKQTPLRSERIRRFGFHSVLAVPIQARGVTLGVATFSRHQRPEPFQQDDLLLAEEITARAAVCIDNARHYTRERSTTLALQSSLLPQGYFRGAAVDVASRYLPTSTQIGVGGDWFDVIALSGARVALVVGDVVGHGIQASATMGRLRTAVRTLADVELPPDELLTHLDDVVNRLSAEAASQPGLVGETGATCLYAVYDPVSRHCTMASAGHLAPAVVTPDGAVEFPDLPPGPPLGLGGLPFEATDIVLPEGSVLVLFTDGLVEFRGRDIDDGIHALREVLSRPLHSLEGTCDTILQSLLPDRPDDDVALLLARTRALDASHVATWDVPAEPAAVSSTRKNVTRQLTAWGLDEASFVTEVVVSELVTNAIRYGAPPIQLRLIHDRSLICEVTDSSNTSPHLRRARTFDEGGRGLLMVAQLTQAWGTRQTRSGKTIWTEQTVAH